jgi:hypothetical protein
VQATPAPGDYVGRYIGPLPHDGPTRTEKGALGLVIEALLKPEHRRGLPIIAPADAIVLAMSGPTPLRPPRIRYRPTDLERYEAALANQRGGDRRPWAPIPHDGGDAA